MLSRLLLSHSVESDPVVILAPPDKLTLSRWNSTKLDTALGRAVSSKSNANGLEDSSATLSQAVMQSAGASQTSWRPGSRLWWDNELVCLKRRRHSAKARNLRQLSKKLSSQLRKAKKREVWRSLVLS